MFFGVGNLRVMMLYRKARKKALEHGACIVFIDEIDAIGQNAGASLGMGLLWAPASGSSTNSSSSSIRLWHGDRRWAQILRRFGFRPKPGPQPVVFTIAATNLPEAL